MKAAVVKKLLGGKDGVGGGVSTHDINYYAT